MSEEELKRLIRIIKGDINTYDEIRKSKYRSRHEQQMADGRYWEARFILDQIREIILDRKRDKGLF